jgi:amino acid adenylation domain-containing protein/non-ribosomal peptide synthase protein (TIGR01720 family)
LRLQKKTTVNQLESVHAFTLGSQGEKHFPLTTAQSQLWLLNQLGKQSSLAYHERIIARLQGKLNQQALQGALQQWVDRHESLRLRFSADGLTQIAQAQVSVAIPEYALSPDAVDAWLEAESQQAFDFAQGPLFRAALLTLPDHEHLLVFTTHHIITDGFSLNILVEELARLYSAQLRQQTIRLEPARQYSDYVAWLAQQLSSDTFKGQLSYWQGQLAAPLPVLLLPTDHPYPAVKSYLGGSHTVRLDASLTQALNRLARQHHGTTFMLALSAYLIFLHRLCNQDDLIVGVPTAGRGMEGGDSVFGYCTHLLPIRSRLVAQQEPAFVDYFNQLKTTLFDAYDHRDYPYADLLNSLDIPRDAIRPPLVSCIFNLDKPGATPDLPGLQMEFLPTARRFFHFDLGLNITELEDGWEASWIYNADILEAATIQRWAENFTTLLKGISENPDRGAYALPLLTEDEQRQLQKWNQTARDYPRDQTIVSLFEAQVRTTPDNVAVVFEGQSLTYAELNSRVNRAAHALMALGVQVDTLVGLCVDRSLEMVVGLLGILKAGGAYVPLDPAYPEKRLRYMLDDCGAKLLLAQSHLQGMLGPLLATKDQRGERRDIEMLSLDTIDLSSWPDRNPTAKVSPDGLAYVIYTSGSTGKPKGVLSHHRGLYNLAKAQVHAFGVLPKSRVLQFASLSFDASVSEWAMALGVGASLYLASRNALMPGDALQSTLNRHLITHVCLPPTALNVMSADACPHPANLIVAGEACPVELAKQWSVGRRFFNAYGPTETTVCATVAEYSQLDDRLAIGKPLANLRAYVLNGQGNPVPIGVPGELCVAGVGLARGYLNQPELTAEKFVELELFCQHERLYRTGDLARWLPDGNLEYLGRIDHQVKLRGFRIELGEVEAVLTQHPAINTAVVVVHERDGNKSLAAYMIFKAGEEATDITALRNWLSDRLPDYMIPASFSVLDALPLTPNGKIDRKALPEPGGLLVAGSYELPRSGTEQQLADIWAAVLNRPAIGIHDNFFELGGDSILSIQIVASARQAGLGINAHAVFQHPTIAKLAQVVQPASAVQAEQGLVQGNVPLTPIQSWFLGSDTPEPWHFNQTMLLTVPENFDEAALRQALAALLRHHDALRLRYRQGGDGWRQTHAAPDDACMPFHSEDLPAADWEIGLETRSTHWQASLDLAKGPLVRMVLFRASQTGRSPSLLWVIHHLAVDGVSWRILLDDLHTAYQQAKEGQPIQLPPKSSSFQAWAEHLRRWTDSAAFTADAAYWHSLSTTVAPLPIDYPHGSNRVADTRHHLLTLDANATRQLLEEAPAAYRTGINDLLLSALLLALQEWGGGQRQHLIDLESHGRVDLFLDLDLSRTVGWFTSLHTIDLTLPDSPDMAQVIQSVKEQLRRIPHEGVACGLLQQQGVVLPKSSVLFNYLGQFDQSRQQGGFSVIQDGSGRSHSLGGSREHVLEINGIAVHGQLELAFSYSGAQYKESTIQHLANRYQFYLQTLLAHCQTHYGYTPADFPLACLDQAQVDSLTRLYQRNIDTVYPLTPMQQGMMFHTLYAPDSGLYFEQVACLITGEIHPATLRAAWQWLVNRHSVLRTAFYHDGLQSLQIVCREAEVPWQDIDWQGLSVDEQRRQREQLMAQERQRGFDLVQAPLMRFHLIREKADSCRLVWHHHHILLDGWCLPILFREMSLVYAALLRQQPPSLPPAQDYRHFIAWLTQQDKNAARHYWQEKLAGFSSPTPIPLSRQGLTEKTLDPKHVCLPLSAVTNQRIHYLARQRRVTTNTLVLTAWAILLGRYSGESDVVFGATTSGRNVPLVGIENMVGLLINTLPLRVKLKGNPVDLSHTLQNQQQADNQYAYTSLADIQSWSETPNGTALFDSLVVFENYPDDDSQRHPQGLPLRFSEVEAIEQTNYLLTLAVTAPPGEQLSFDLGFDANRIQPETATRILGHLDVLLTSIADNPEADIHSLSLLTVAEQQQLTLWNQTAVDYPQGQTIVSLFERQVGQTPDNTALIFESQSLTYAELNEQANQLAHHLLNLKNPDGNALITGNPLVAIAVERSFDMVIGLLAILKAGGAYVPVDPSYPPSRIRYMLEDSAAPVLLTQSHLQAQLPLNEWQHECVVICLDGMDLSIHPSANLASKSQPEDLAYVIYTSGSTGKPKGTLLTHQGFGNYLQWAVHYYEVVHGNGAPVQSSIGFDATITSLYLPLISGRPVVLLPEHEEIEALASALRQGPRFSLVKITPAHLEILNHQLSQNEYANASHALVLGGEALTSVHIEPWLRYAPDTHLINEYGPTETVVGCCIYDAKGQTLLEGSIPIGRPIANTRLYILNSHHQLQPPGIPGELCIAGAGLARGYLNRPELTAEKFIVVELLGKTERIYKTGDLARWLPDGNLEYLGRIDQQIKLRGFRIELGEIETLLAQHPAVSGAVAMVHERNGVKSLAAYVTLADGQDALDTTNTAVLRTWLGAQLPDYMVPAAFVILPAFPLTPNGKIDRKSLPEPDYTERQTPHQPPHTETEKRLAELFSSVLSVGDIGIDDNFFELGGDSIISIQLVSRARQAGLNFTPRDVFQHPTIAGLAVIAGELPQPQPIAQGLLLGEVPLLPIQQAFFAARAIEPQHFNQATCYSAPANLNLEYLTAALRHLLMHHDALRACYRQTGQGWQQFFAAPEEVSLSVQRIDCTAWEQGQRLARLAVLVDQLQADLDLSQPALMRIAWFDYGDTEPGHLVWVIHHLIVDGVSWRILVEDLNTLYRQLQQAQALALPPKTNSYADWVAYLQEYTRSDLVTGKHLAYWEQLKQQPIAELPCDHAYQAEDNTVASVREISLTFDQARTQALLEEAPKAYHTHINDLLLTALAMAIQSWHGSSDLLLDLESHGRHTNDESPAIDLSRTVGWFTTIYPVHLKLTSDHIGKNIKAIKEQLRRVPDQGLSYGTLCHLNHRLADLPKAQILFNYLGQFDNATQGNTGENLILEEIPTDLGQSHSPLQQREYLLEINGWVSDRQLHFFWTYSQNVHDATHIEALAHAFGQSLNALIQHCLADNAGGFTPSDFSLADLDQAELDDVLNAVLDL